MALKKFLMVAFVAAVLVACGDDSSSATDSDEVSSSSVCEDCDGSSSSKAKSSSSFSVTPQSSERETSVSSSSSAKSSSSEKKTESSSSMTSSLSSSVDSSSSSVKSSSSSSAKSSSSSANLSSSSFVAEYEGHVDPSTVVKGTMTDDRDGQTYKTVKIGTQTWMAENLNYAYIGVPYNYDSHTSDSTSWSYCNDSAECSKYGRFYTWAAAMDSVGTWTTNGKGCGYKTECSPTYPVRGICPEGWHLPDSTEWYMLFDAVGGRSTAGLMLKSTSGWYGSGNGTDAYAFSALSAGFRFSAGGFYTAGYLAKFWSSTEVNRYNAYRIYLDKDDDHASLYGDAKAGGYSVRCLKD